MAVVTRARNSLGSRPPQPAAQLLKAVIQIDLELNRAAMATTALGIHDARPVRSNGSDLERFLSD
jgi:hypothetical protein